MNSVTLENFRCFGEKQTVRLAPLTLLVGENSTGKTSFLALIRALWDMAYASRVPDFKEPPWDLGSYDEVAHHRGARGGRADTIVAGFTLRRGRSPKRCAERVSVLACQGSDRALARIQVSGPRKELDYRDAVADEALFASRGDESRRVAAAGDRRLSSVEGWIHCTTRVVHLLQSQSIRHGRI